MYLAEALAERAEAQSRYQQVSQRLNTQALVQDGDTPEEDPKDLLRECEQLIDRIEYLVQRINATNVSTAFNDTMTLADALTHREALGRRKRLCDSAANEGSASRTRYRASEIKFVSAVDVKDLRNKADQAAKQFRLMDTQIQRLNWTVELIE